MEHNTLEQEYSYTFPVLFRFRVWYVCMGLFSLGVSWFSLQLLPTMFALLPLFGNQPVPNIPILVFGFIVIFQSIGLVFIAVYFFIRSHWRLVITQSHVSLVSYWYTMTVPWEYVEDIVYQATWRSVFPIFIFNSPGILQQRRRRRGLYRLNQRSIPIGLFGRIEVHQELYRILQVHLPHLIKSE
jgi:hypothetical protein